MANPLKMLKEQNELINRLIARAPPGWKLIFLNYEIQDPEEGAVSSHDIFAITKPLLGKAKRVDLEITANDRQLIYIICRHFMAEAKQSYMTLDLLIRRAGRYKLYLDYDQPLRLNGALQEANRHLRYQKDDKLLSEIPLRLY